VRVLVYEDLQGTGPAGSSPARVEAILQSVVTRTQTDAHGLVTAVYLMRHRVGWGGCLVSSRPVGTDRLTHGAGRWRFVRHFPPPPNLPNQFALIRLAFDAEHLRAGKRVIHDRYGWRFECADFEAHLAWLFAHELHHFRRHHLGLHAGEGEHSANAWALEKVRRMGFAATGARQSVRSRRRGRSAASAPGADPQFRVQVQALAACLDRVELLALRQWIDDRLTALQDPTGPGAIADHCERLRRLPDGAEVLIIHDSRGRYAGQRAVKLQTPRRGTVRLIIRTADGREWRYPMAWLKVPDHEHP
jgi:hypothetical protein